jgi:hypothetical protein
VTAAGILNPHYQFMVAFCLLWFSLAWSTDYLNRKPVT